MDPISELEQVKKYYPFMTCIVKVNTKTQWPKTVAKILSKIQGVQNFRMDPEGYVEISGTVDPDLLLKMLGKSGKKAQLFWFQFGECSSNLFMSNRTANVAPGSYGRYIQNGDYPRPKLPSNDGHNRNRKHDDPRTRDLMHNFEQAHEHLHDRKPLPPPHVPPDTRDRTLTFEQAHRQLHHNKSSLAPRTNAYTLGPGRVSSHALLDTRDHMQTFEQAHKHSRDHKPSLAPRTNANLERGRFSTSRAPPIICEGISCCSLM